MYTVNLTKLMVSLDLSRSKVTTAVLKEGATVNIDYASRDDIQTQQNASRSCDSNFVCRTIELEHIKHVDIEIECKVLCSKKSLALS